MSPMSEVLVLNSSQEAFDSIVKARGLESFQFLRKTSTDEALSWLGQDENKTWLILFDDSSLKDHGPQNWLEWLKRHTPHIKKGFMASYGQERLAKQLYADSSVDFYVQQPFSSCLITAEILSCLENKPSLSITLNEILEMAIDANSTPVTEYIANIKRTYTTR